jgi:hypothetical protein
LSSLLVVIHRLLDFQVEDMSPWNQIVPPILLADVDVLVLNRTIKKCLTSSVPMENVLFWYFCLAITLQMDKELSTGSHF